MMPLQIPERTFRAISNRSAVVDCDNVFVCPERALLQKVSEQPLMIAVDRLGKRSFYLVPNGNCKCETLRVKSSHWPRDVNDAQQIAVLRMPDRRSRTRPNANFIAEMFGSMDLHRFQRRYGGSDGICPNVCLFPASSLFK